MNENDRIKQTIIDFVKGGGNESIYPKKSQKEQLERWKWPKKKASGKKNNRKPVANIV